MPLPIIVEHTENIWFSFLIGNLVQLDESLKVRGPLRGQAVRTRAMRPRRPCVPKRIAVRRKSRQIRLHSRPMVRPRHEPGETEPWEVVSFPAIAEEDEIHHIESPLGAR